MSRPRNTGQPRNQHVPRPHNDIQNPRGNIQPPIPGSKPPSNVAPTMPSPTQSRMDNSPPSMQPYNHPPCYTTPEHNTPPPGDIYTDFSLTSPQEYFAHETRLYQRINFQAKIRLGYGKAISVLQRELDGSQEYIRLTRPYQIDQPDNLPMLSPLIPNSEARLFADTVRALVDIIGLQRACHLLENAEVAEIPGIQYEIQRVIIPTHIPMEFEGSAAPQSMPEIGLFTRTRSDSVSSTTDTDSTMPPTPNNMSPSSRPTIVGDDLIPEDSLTQPVIALPYSPRQCWCE